ncbi:MAG: hypothetical protein ACT4UP_04230 [Gammaproteobacteria bacterium]
MDEKQSERLVTLLEQVRDNQAEQLRRQGEALALQKEQFEIFRRQAERAEKLQDRAEELQSRSMGIVKTARRSLAVVLPVVILLVIYLSWLIFR